MDRKEVLLKCLAGHMLTSKLNANPWARWDGWELKYSLLKKVSFRMNGLKMVNLILGISTINPSATRWMVVMETEKSSET
jgi:hypothetical protein